MARSSPLSRSSTIGSGSRWQACGLWITGAADDRTFAITDGEGLFVLHIAANGRSARLSRVPVRVRYPDTEASVISPNG